MLGWIRLMGLRVGCRLGVAGGEVQDEGAGSRVRICVWLVGFLDKMNEIFGFNFLGQSVEQK